MSETAVGYLRLSQDGTSLDRQHREVADYATANDTDLIEIYNEGPPSIGL